MITNFKINNYDILADRRVKAEVSGLQPATSTPSSSSVGGNKRINSTIRSNRIIQVGGYIVLDIQNAINDIYSNWIVGEPVAVEITTEDGEVFTETAIIKQLDIERYQSKVPLVILIECYTAFFYKSEEVFEAANTAITEATIDSGDIDQHNITISHTVGADEKSFTVNFLGTTTVEFDGDYSGQTVVIDCQEQTCYIDNANRFYLVTSWQDGSDGEINIPVNTTVTYKKMVRGLW